MPTLDNIAENKQEIEHYNLSNIKLRNPPKHLALFHEQLDSEQYPSCISPFYAAVKQTVEKHKQLLKNEQSKVFSKFFPDFFVDVWETRIQDLQELEHELENGLSVKKFNDFRLIMLCQHIVNQKTPIFFGHAALLNHLKKLLEKFMLGELNANFPFSFQESALEIKYKKLKIQISETQKQISSMQIHQSELEKIIIDQKKLHEEQLEKERARWIKENAEMKLLVSERQLEWEIRLALKELPIKKEYEFREKELKKEIDNLHDRIKFDQEKYQISLAEEKEKREQEILKFKTANTEQEIFLKTTLENNDKTWNERLLKMQQENNELKKLNMQLVKDAVQAQQKSDECKKKAEQFDKYIGTKNYCPSFFSSLTNSDNNVKKPSALLLCPIDYEIMLEPVIAEDGYTYEKKNIETWFQIKKTSPLMGTPIETKLIPNRIIQDLVNDWLQFSNSKMFSETTIRKENTSPTIVSNFKM